MPIARDILLHGRTTSGSSGTLVMPAGIRSSPDPLVEDGPPCMKMGARHDQQRPADR
jgi:hypothetical protein